MCIFQTSLLYFPQNKLSELGLVWSNLQERAEAFIDPKQSGGDQTEASSQEGRADKNTTETSEASAEVTGLDTSGDEWKQIWITHGKHYRIYFMPCLW